MTRPRGGSAAPTRPHRTLDGGGRAGCFGARGEAHDRQPASQPPSPQGRGTGIKKLDTNLGPKLHPQVMPLGGTFLMLWIGAKVYFFVPSRSNHPPPLPLFTAGSPLPAAGSC